MMKALFCVVVAGAAIGFMIPTGSQPSPAPVEAAPVVPKERKPFAAVQPQETLLARRDNGHFHVTADVNGQPVEFVVDTGATTVALTTGDAERLGLDFHPGEFTTVGRGASGDVRGKPVQLDVIDIDGKRVPEVPGVIVEGLDVSLLGQSYLSRISAVQMNGDQMTLR